MALFIGPTLIHSEHQYHQFRCLIISDVWSISTKTQSFRLFCWISYFVLLWSCIYCKPFVKQNVRLIHIKWPFSMIAHTWCFFWLQFISTANVFHRLAVTVAFKGALWHPTTRKASHTIVKLYFINHSALHIFPFSFFNFLFESTSPCCELSAFFS